MVHFVAAVPTARLQKENCVLCRYRDRVPATCLLAALFPEASSRLQSSTERSKRPPHHRRGRLQPQQCIKHAHNSRHNINKTKAAQNQDGSFPVRVHHISEAWRSEKSIVLWHVRLCGARPVAVAGRNYRFSPAYRQPPLYAKQVARHAAAVLRGAKINAGAKTEGHTVL